MTGGRVTVTAKNATVGQILAEWAKVGQTKIVNAERVPGGPVTLELKDVPEAEALEVLLRSAGGYVLAPRRMETANASRYDRILILPQSAPSPAPRPMDTLGCKVETKEGVAEVWVEYQNFKTGVGEKRALS